MGTLASCLLSSTSLSKQDTTVAQPSVRYPIDSAGDVPAFSVSLGVCGPPVGDSKHQEVVSGALQSPEVKQQGKRENKRRTGLSKLAKLGEATGHELLASDTIRECHDSYRNEDRECLLSADKTHSWVLQNGKSEKCIVTSLEMPNQHMQTLLQTSANNINSPHGELSRTTTPTMVVLHQHGLSMTDLMPSAKAEFQTKEERYGDSADTLVLWGAGDIREHLTVGLARDSLHLGKHTTSGQTSPEVKSSSIDVLSYHPFASCKLRSATDSFSHSPHSPHRNRVRSPSSFTLPRSPQSTCIPSLPPLNIPCSPSYRPIPGLSHPTHYSHHPTYCSPHSYYCSPHSYYCSPPSTADVFARETYYLDMNEEPPSQTCPRSPSSRALPGSVCTLDKSPTSRSLPRSLLPLSYSRSPLLPPLTISNSTRWTKGEGTLCADNQTIACQPFPKQEAQEISVSHRRHAGHKRNKCGHSQHTAHSPNTSPPTGAMFAVRARHQRREPGSMSLEELMQRYVPTDAELLEVGAVTGTEAVKEEKGSDSPTSPLLPLSALTSRCCDGVLQATDKNRLTVVTAHIPAISSYASHGFLSHTPGLVAETLKSAIYCFAQDDLQCQTLVSHVEIPGLHSQSDKIVLSIEQQGITKDTIGKCPLQGHTEMAVHTRASDTDGGTEKWQTENEHLEPALYQGREAVGSEVDIKERDTGLGEVKGEFPCRDGSRRSTSCTLTTSTSTTRANMTSARRLALNSWRNNQVLGNTMMPWKRVLAYVKLGKKDQRSRKSVGQRKERKSCGEVKVTQHSGM